MATCAHCKSEMQTDGISSWCVQAGCASDHFDDFDGEDDAAGDDEWELECGLASDGQCSQAGTEHCDWLCPNSSSELFVGSAAWREKRNPKRRKATAK